MSPKFMAGVYVLWITLTIMASAMDGLMFVRSRESMIDSMIVSQIGKIQGSGILLIPLTIGGFIQSLGSMIIWNFPFLNNDVGFFLKIVFLYPISVAVIISIITLLSSVMQSTAGTIAVVGGVIGGAGATLMSIFS